MSILPGTAKGKRARRGCERDWNRYSEPLRRFLKGGRHMPTSRLYLRYRRLRDKEW